MQILRMSLSNEGSLWVFIYILKKVLSEVMLSDCFECSIWIKKKAVLFAGTKNLKLGKHFNILNLNMN